MVLWNSIINDFPENDAYVYVKLSNRHESLLCRYKNDSFGLGDLDLEVERWRYVFPPKAHLETHLEPFEPISLVEGHIGVGSS